MPIGFNTEQYNYFQQEAFRERIAHNPSQALIEFGGKPFDDQHAARTLPGYEADAKAEILKSLLPSAEIIMVVNARDLLGSPDGRYPQGRLRGDSGLFYREEVVRLILRARELALPITETVIAITPRVLYDASNQLLLDDLQNKLAALGINSRRFYAVPNYPHIETQAFETYTHTFETNGRLSTSDKGVVLFSPGGGSGKFGVILSETYFQLKDKQIPNYIKFETFPVFNLDMHHALNLAFMAATADLKNQTTTSPYGKTSYDKDVQNYRLLKWLFRRMGYADSLQQLEDPADMSVNRIVDGVTDWPIVIEACREEIVRRVARYRTEIKNGLESPATLAYARDIQQIFEERYPKSKTVFLFS